MNAAPSLQVRVNRVIDEAVDIRSFELHAVDGGELPAFDAGAHLDVHVPGGPVRQYSLCNDPVERHRYLIAVMRDPASRGGSAGMHERVRCGDQIGIGVPRNHFRLASAAKHSLLFAGGIGVTPIICMAEHLWREDAPFSMHYCTRSVERTAFLARLKSAPFASSFAVHLDDAEPEQKLNLPRVLAGQPPDTHLYVCGPKGFMDAILKTARNSGWTEDRIHFEFFSAEVAKPNDDGFDVRLARSERVIRVSGHRTVVQALSSAGVDVPTSCEQGVCGTCLTSVLAGIPDHRDMYLTNEERALNDRFLPCCSRSLSPELVIDL